MAPYSPLQMHDLDHQHEDAEDDTLLPGKHITSEHRTVDPASKLPAWTALALPVIAVICAFALYNIASASVSGQRGVQGLSQPNQFPGIELVDDPRQKQKGLDVLSVASQSFQIHLLLYRQHRPPTVEDGLAANKSYTASGSITEIQIWNVTTPAEGMMSLSWNTRPRRIALMGTVAFLPEKEKIEQLGLEDGWQSQLATRFSCGKKASVVTIEVACDSCNIEFEQLFSIPPLAFDLMEIG
ncbi:hypothetical protein EDD22DRAFT_959693 [Suillus occidentalis]|nr:hypothetical protein EDD22DRAFT_959693 [Suillus occidentalis]